MARRACSDSTVKLITKVFAELKADPKIGRAEALRRSMVSMFTTGKDYEAHPAFWAPFVLVAKAEPIDSRDVGSCRNDRTFGSDARRSGVGH
ncbi:MAG TPA: CHAT domain-containing protein [Xanthobacteraceae bacterium]